MGLINSTYPTKAEMPQRKETPSNKVLQFVIGAALYPVLLETQIVTQEVLAALGKTAISAEEIFVMIKGQVEYLMGGFDGTVSDSHPLQLPLLVSQSVGTTIIFQDFIQSDLLEKRLPLLSRKISPDLEHFLHKTHAKMTRILLSSLLYATLKPYITCSRARPAYHQLAYFVNDFICGIFSSSLKELTRSSTPAIALNMFRDYLALIY